MGLFLLDSSHLLPVDSLVNFLNACKLRKRSETSRIRNGTEGSNPTRSASKS